MPNEQKVDELLADLKREIMTRNTFKVQAVLHSAESQFEDIPDGGFTDGCVIFYLDNSDEEKLFNDLRQKFAPVLAAPDNKLSNNTDIVKCIPFKIRLADDIDSSLLAMAADSEELPDADWD